MASAYDERHAVVQMALAHLIREARRCGMTCSICGQAPARYPGINRGSGGLGHRLHFGGDGCSDLYPRAFWQAEQTG